MKTTQKTILVSIFIMIVSITLYTQVHAAGLLQPVNGGKNTIEMKMHEVDVVINNGFAKTQVDQVFVNTGDQDLEAIYSFPVPKNASLSELSLWIDGAEVLGEVMGKQKAKQVYDSQKSKGNTTAMAEKNEYKTFDIHVSPVKSKDETRVRLVYYQPLEIDLNVGRYIYPLEEGNTDDDRISFWETDDRVKQSFTFNAVLKSAFPIKEIRLPGFQDQAVISERSDQAGTQTDAYDIKLDFPEGSRLSRDIVVYYRLDDHTPARMELIPYREAGSPQGKFMLVITPGSDLVPISNGTDWIFVLDVSGSMDGEKLSTLVSGVRQSIQKMSASHRFKIITFNNQAQELTRGFVPATDENIRKISHVLDTIQAGGGTALFEGLEKAYNAMDADRTTGIILVTDGVANVGPSKHAQLLGLHRKYDCRLFTFVIGNSANQPLLDTLAKESGGFAMNVSSNDDMIGRLLQAKVKMIHESLVDARVRFKGERVSDLTPQAIGNLYMGQQIVLFGSYLVPGQVEIELTGKIDGQPQKWTTQAVFPAQNLDNPEIERLWAFSAIEEIAEKIRQQGETDALRKKIVTLGTQYALVTDFTSMVVLNDQEMENLGLKRNNFSRVQKERAAQAVKATAPVKHYRVADSDSSGQMFSNQTASNVGTGAVGPLFVGMIILLRTLRSRKE